MNGPHLSTRCDSSDGESVRDFLAAEEAVARLSRDYPQWASRDLAQAREILDRLDDSATPGADVTYLREFAHNTKGQGGSFGFSLASDIAESLWIYLTNIDAPTALQRRTIAVHLDALRVVFHRRITGQGGEMGQTLLARLQSICAVTQA